MGKVKYNGVLVALGWDADFPPNRKGDVHKNDLVSD
jgi:hypothetical protein